MTYLLDTNALSESTRSTSVKHVVDWVDDHEHASCISVITLAEMLRGIELLADGRRRSVLRQWAEDVIPARFAGRILSIDPRVARRWSRMMVESQRRGIQLGAMDGFIAATAAEHGLILVTRNVRHFTGLDIPLINPWDDLP